MEEICSPGYGRPELVKEVSCLRSHLPSSALQTRMPVFGHHKYYKGQKVNLAKIFESGQDRMTHILQTNLTLLNRMYYKAKILERSC